MQEAVYSLECGIIDFNAPAAGNLEAGTGDHGGAASGPVTSTGVEIPVSLSFVESSDLEH